MGSRNVCNECGKILANFSNLNRHKKTVHAKKRMCNGDGYICDVCRKECRGRENFKNHWRYKHASKAIEVTLPKCPLCKCDIKTHLLKEHFDREHGIRFDEKEYKFANETSFQKWKEKLEKDTYSKFVLQYTMKQRKRRKYQCHRSGIFNSKSKGVRHLKSQGSKKLGGYCPASIRVTDCGECVRVKFTSTHIGHDCNDDLCHLNIPPAKKDEIARQLMEKVPRSSILEHIRDSCDGVVKREHLITMQDLDNVAAKLNLTSYFKEEQKDGGGAAAAATATPTAALTGVHSTINDLRQEENSFVLFCKHRNDSGGEVVASYPPFLRDDDFVLIIMNPAQAVILKKYGNKIVCVDSMATEIDRQNFVLFSIVVLDDLHEGFPCAIMISNRKDAAILEFFCASIRSALGQRVTPQVFMSNMADEVYEGWRCAMGAVPLRLYCAWHVDKTWRHHLNKVKNADKRTALYQRLKGVMQELDENRFVIALDDLMKWLAAVREYREFGQYFSSTFANNARRWAYCYRKNAGINTNVCVERIHRSIKNGYVPDEQLEGSAALGDNRLDRFIYRVIKYLKDKLFDRLTILHKGKVSRKVRVLRKRHRQSTSVDVTTVVDDHVKSFLVTSSDGNIYHVERSDRSADDDDDDHCHNCRLFCTYCDACIHDYCCTCADYCIPWNMCKHIHAVCQFLRTHSLVALVPLVESPSPSDSDITDDEELVDCKYFIVDDVAIGGGDNGQIAPHRRGMGADDEKIVIVNEICKRRRQRRQRRQKRQRYRQHSRHKRNSGAITRKYFKLVRRRNAINSSSVGRVFAYKNIRNVLRPPTMAMRFQNARKNIRDYDRNVLLLRRLPIRTSATSSRQKHRRKQTKKEGSVS